MNIEINSGYRDVFFKDLTLDNPSLSCSKEYLDKVYTVFEKIVKDAHIQRQSYTLAQSKTDLMKEVIAAICKGDSTSDQESFMKSILYLLLDFPFSQEDPLMIEALEYFIERNNKLYLLIFTKISNGIILPLQALQYIQDSFREKYITKSNKISCEFLDSFEELRDCLVKLKTDDYFNKTIVVRHPTSAHVTQIYAFKEKGLVRFFISDSLGNITPKDKNARRFTHAMIKEIYSIMEGHPFELFAAEEQRQYDHTNCAVFALHDVKQIIKQNDFFTFLQQNGEISCKTYEVEENACIDVQWVTSLPKEFLKIDQSLSKLNALGSKKIEKIDKKYKWLTNSNKNQNGYVVYKRNQMIKMIMQKAFGDSVEHSINKTI